MNGLPHEHDCARSPEEALMDLQRIAVAEHGRDEAHVTVDPDGGEPVTVTGHVDLVVVGGGSATRLTVDGAVIADIDPQRCRGGWLNSYDGADYYRLRIDLGDFRLELSDAYNGL